MKLLYKNQPQMDADGRRWGGKAENIEHRTSNAEHRRGNGERLAGTLAPPACRAFLIRNPQSAIRNGIRDSSRRLLRREGGFTLVELLVVISIIALLAGLLVGGAMHAVNIMRRSRVEAERDQLITAIDRFHKKKGFYPADNSKDPACVQTPLFYELTGVTPTVQAGIVTAFQSKVGSETLQISDVTNLFNVGGFINCDNSENSAENFFSGIKANQHLYTTPLIAAPANFSVLGVGVSGPLQMNPATGGTGSSFINPWHYNSSHPTNNVDSYDLWIDVNYAGHSNRISNWSKDPEVLK